MSNLKTCSLLSVKWAYHRLRLPEVTEGHPPPPRRPGETAEGRTRSDTQSFYTNTQNKWLLSLCFFHQSGFWLAAQSPDNHQLHPPILLFNLCLCVHSDRLAAPNVCAHSFHLTCSLDTSICSKVSHLSWFGWIWFTWEIEHVRLPPRYHTCDAPEKRLTVNSAGQWMISNEEGTFPFPFCGLIFTLMLMLFSFQFTAFRSDSENCPTFLICGGQSLSF